MEESRKMVREALNHYAAFFAGVTEGHQEAALNNLARIKEIDASAESTLQNESLDYYRHKRTQLMRLFRLRLIDQLKDQVKQDVLEKAEALVSELESGEGFQKTLSEQLEIERSSE